jgi:chromatin segregation and condensation protein Rec8/ScpA/Scc1 (kleisin family)
MNNSSDPMVAMDIQIQAENERRQDIMRRHNADPTNEELAGELSASEERLRELTRRAEEPSA